MIRFITLICLMFTCTLQAYTPAMIDGDGGNCAGKPVVDVLIIQRVKEGRYFDQETGLHYFRARYFDSALNTFISRDPLGYVDGTSMYVGYFANGMGLDPSGLHKGLKEHGDISVNDKSCTVTLDLEIQLIFKDILMTKRWSPSLKKKWAKDAKKAIEDVWNNSGFKLKPSKKGWSTTHIDWEHFCPGEHPSILRSEWHECPCQDGYDIKVNVTMDTGVSIDEDIEATVALERDNAWPTSSVTGSTSILDSNDIFPKPSNMTAPKQVSIAHEFGHMIGLHHPNPGGDNEYLTPDGQRTAVGYPNDDIMGQGMKVHSKHLKRWKEALEDEHSDCGPYKFIKGK